MQGQAAPAQLDQASKAPSLEGHQCLDYYDINCYGLRPWIWHHEVFERIVVGLGMASALCNESPPHFPVSVCVSRTSANG